MQHETKLDLLELQKKLMENFNKHLEITITANTLRFILTALSELSNDVDELKKGK